MFEVALGPISPNEMSFAAGVLARGMRDNPNPVAVFGSDPDARTYWLERLFRPQLVSRRLATICARRNGIIVGVSASVGMEPPRAGRPTLAQRARFLPAMARMGPGRVLRLRRWTAEWEKRELEEPHWHGGPLAVEPALQGLGIGSELLAWRCRDADANGRVMYAETDSADSVRFHRRFGFEVIAEGLVLGQPNWYMRRPRNGA